MKKIVLLFTLMSFLLIHSESFAQKKHSKKETTEKKESTEKKETKAISHKSTGVNKDGTPDMRLKANKEAAKAKAAKDDAARSAAVSASEPGTATATRTQTTTTRTATNSRSSSVSTSALSNGDKVIGTDDKGRTIYEGKRGGHYYINKNGNKEYIKRS
jgi:hypothetical protein